MPESVAPGRLGVAAYAAPGLALAVPTIPVAVLVPSYYAEDLGLGVAATGAALAAARTLDFLADPLAGAMSDRLRGRFGRRKPVILVGALLAGIGLWAVTHPPAAVNAGWLFGWSLLLFIGWSLVAVPHAAWAADFSEARLRANLVGAREGMMLLGMCIAVAAPVAGAHLGVTGFTGPAGLALVAIGAGIPAFLFMALTLPQPPPMGAPPAWSPQALRDLLRNREFSRLLCAWFVNGLANGLPAVLFPLVVQRWFGLDGRALDWLMLLYFGCAVLALPLWPWLGNRHGKQRVWRITMALAAGVFVCMLAIPQEGHLAYVAVCVVTGALLGADLVLPSALQTDVIERDTAAHGCARGALFFGVWSMATKAALAMAIALGFGGLALAGYEEIAPLGETAGRALLLLYAGVPVALKLLAVWMVRRPMALSAR